MIEIQQGNRLEANAEALANTVNWVGFTGKVIVLQLAIDRAHIAKKGETAAGLKNGFQPR